MGKKADGHRERDTKKQTGKHYDQDMAIKQESEEYPMASSVLADGIHYEQAAVVPYCWVGLRVHIYLISTLKRKHWIVPKGLVEDGRSHIETAVLETFEEAGLVGVVDGTTIGFHQTYKWGGVCDITVYPMKVLAEVAIWPELDMRERLLVDYHEGSWRTLVDDPGLLAILEQFGSVVDPDVQNDTKDSEIAASEEIGSQSGLDVVGESSQPGVASEASSVTEAHTVQPASQEQSEKE